MAINQVVYPVLLGYTAWVAVFDFKRRRIPNAVSFLLLFSGLILNGLHVPVTIVVFMGLYLAWLAGWIGGGDAKLWMGLICFAPVGHATAAAVVLGLVWMTTGAVQLAFRHLACRPVRGVRAPGAWRALPYACWLLWVS